MQKRSHKRKMRQERRRVRRQLEKLDPEVIELLVGDQPINKAWRAKKPSEIHAKTQAQGLLLSLMADRDIVFATGPAGTGKTYVSVGHAADKLGSGQIDRIILTRPQVGTEDLGALPGDDVEKTEPWVIPMLDVLEERLGKSKVENLRKHGQIQIVPLGLMRGSSYRRTWVFLDEAQNSTVKQMKMFLTRIGEGSKFIVTGDLKQSDLKASNGAEMVNGLEDAIARLKGAPGVGFVEFTRDDIVRHGIVRTVLDRYEG